MTIDRAMATRLMDAAIEQAEKGWSEGGIPIGSVLARADGTIVARGHNQRVQSGDPILHAVLRRDKISLGDLEAAIAGARARLAVASEAQDGSSSLSQ